MVYITGRKKKEFRLKFLEPSIDGKFDSKEEKFIFIQSYQN